MFVKDPCRHLLKKWDGVQTTCGVFSDEFQLSDQPNLGNWTIKASLGDQVSFHEANIQECTLNIHSNIGKNSYSRSGRIRVAEV